MRVLTAITANALRDGSTTATLTAGQAQDLQLAAEQASRTRASEVDRVGPRLTPPPAACVQKYIR